MQGLNVQRGRLRVFVPLVVIWILLALSGCGFESAAEVAAVTPTVTATPAPFNPSVTPVPSPTDLPPVTPPTEAPPPTITATPTRDPSAVTVLMQPNLGDFGQVVTVNGFGFEPDSSVALHWTQPGVAPGGAAFKTVEVDDEGEFETTVTIPRDWPGGTPTEHAFLELRVIGEENREAWATYAYVPPFEQFQAPGATYTSTAHGYAVDIPPGWEWEDSDPANVTFGPGGVANGSFIRVVANPDVDAVISAVMGEVASGIAYNVEDGLLGTQAGKRVVADDGQVYWFLEHGGSTYALHFVADEEVAEFTYSTLRFTS